MTTYACSPNNTPIVPDFIWELGYSVAETTGCCYPGQPAGVFVRVLLDNATDVTEDTARQLIEQTVAQCDACYGDCTVRHKNCRDLAAIAEVTLVAGHDSQSAA